VERAWEIRFTEAAEKWLRGLPRGEQAKMVHRLDQLAQTGPGLKRPAVGALNGSRYRNMKELRPGASSQRLSFAFDPRGRAIMLAGVDKATGTGSRAYRQFVRTSDERFTAHLNGTGRETSWAATRAGTRSADRSR
jgi:hypothetical protein